MSGRPRAAGRRAARRRFPVRRSVVRCGASCPEACPPLSAGTRMGQDDALSRERLRLRHGHVSSGTPRPGWVSLHDGRSPDSRVWACLRLPAPSGQWLSQGRSPLTVAGAVADLVADAYASPRSLLILHHFGFRNRHFFVSRSSTHRQALSGAVKSCSFESLSRNCLAKFWKSADQLRIE